MRPPARRDHGGTRPGGKAEVRGQKQVAGKQKTDHNRLNPEAVKNAATVGDKHSSIKVGNPRTGTFRHQGSRPSTPRKLKPKGRIGKAEMKERKEEVRN